MVNSDNPSALTSISDFILSSKVATMQQKDSIAHKLKPRFFHKFAIIIIKFTYSMHL